VLVNDDVNLVSNVGLLSLATEVRGLAPMVHPKTLDMFNILETSVVIVNIRGRIDRSD